MLKNARGFSLVEIMVASGLLAGLAVGLTSFYSQYTKQLKLQDHRGLVLDIEGTLRTVLTSPEMCKCNFLGTNLSGSSQDLSQLKIFATGSGCNQATARNFLTAGASYAQGMKINTIKLKNIVAMGAAQKMGDLEISYNTGSGNMPVKPTVFRNISFTLDQANALQTCNYLARENTQAIATGEGRISFNGSEVRFLNSSGNLVSSSIVSTDATGTIIFFTTPSGRSLMMKFKVEGNSLIAINIPGWRNQFCYSHAPSQAPCFAKLLWTQTVYERNCGSGLRWEGAFVGKTTDFFPVVEGTCTNSTPAATSAASSFKCTAQSPATANCAPASVQPLNPPI